MQREVIKTSAAPAAIGPYEQGILASGFLFTAGQIALDPATGQFLSGEIEAETERVLKNLEAIVRAGGLTLNDVVKTTVYLADMSQFPRMNQVYEKFFPADKPARSTVQAAALPKGAKVEIDAIAAVRR